jgi:hypothetical protein
MRGRLDGSASMFFLEGLTDLGITQVKTEETMVKGVDIFQILIDKKQ